MPTIDFNTLLSQMITAAKESLADKWPAIAELTTSSLKTISQNVIDIEEMLAAGVISQEQAKLKFEIQKNAFKTMLLTEEGLGLLAVEAALNAVIKIIKDTVNTAVGLIFL